MIPHTPVYMHRFPALIHNMPNPVQVAIIAAQCLLYEHKVEVSNNLRAVAIVVGLFQTHVA
jgi:hypothetical protein